MANETATSRKYRKMAAETRERLDQVDETDEAVRTYLRQTAEHYERRAAELERKQAIRNAKRSAQRHGPGGDLGLDPR